MKEKRDRDEKSHFPTLQPNDDDDKKKYGEVKKIVAFQKSSPSLLIIWYYVCVCVCVYKAVYYEVPVACLTGEANTNKYQYTRNDFLVRRSSHVG